MNEIELKFSSREEFERELDANLKRGGVFIPNTNPLPLRTKVLVKIYLPESEEPIPAEGEVVQVFGSGEMVGLAIHLQETEKLIKEIEQKMKRLNSVDLVEEQPLELSEGAKEERAEDGEGLGEEEVEEETKKILSSAGLMGTDLSNLYLAVRSLPMTEKIKLAKRGNRKVVSILIQEGNKQLMRFIIQNPKLGVPEILMLLKSPQITMEIIQEIARNPAWTQNEEIRYQLTIHPKTPLPTSLSLLSGLNQRQLGLIAKSSHVKVQLKSSALKLLMKRQSTT